MFHVCDFFQGPKSDLQLPCDKAVLNFIVAFYRLSFVHYVEVGNVTILLIAPTFVT